MAQEMMKMGRMWRRRMADHCGLLRTLSKKNFSASQIFGLILETH
jgi:hypothetical protein